ncbi:thiol-disulfide oxidoreductase DCC family protein [Jannaschia sp. 2305UL9-9]|uniref:thiol-disulfide oxidoreductase DCC family protein n=1 Tax=Jannaschia sp. 2305UL9-9 TaxID=3121638 RepID=UPI003529C702
MSASQGKAQTRVLYNAECPVCAFEINHYRKRTARDGLPVRFDDLHGRALSDWGLDADTAARRLHVLKDGQVISGMPAFRALWREMPHVAWLSRATSVPGVRQAFDWSYDAIFAPLLYRMHRRRLAKRKDR